VNSLQPASTPAIAAAPPAATTAAPRLLSLDALRGFDMFWILGADAFVRALARAWNIPPLQFLAGQLEHKTWEGFAFYDLIFPLFVFIVGVSLVFSLSRIVEQHGRAGAVKRILRRAALLYLLGIFYNGGLTNPWPAVRLTGVLQHIAVAYAATGLLFCFCRPRTVAAIGATLLAGYWALLTFVPVRNIPLERNAIPKLLPVATSGPAATLRPPQPEPARVRELFDATTERVTGRFDAGLNVANHFDYQFLPGRKYDLYWDPEGVLSWLGAIVVAIIGSMAGLLLRRADLASTRKIVCLASGAAVAVTLGWLWHLQVPVVKKIWSPSFVLVASGYGGLLLAGFYYLVDVRQWRGWAQPFVWIGTNAITLYIATVVVSFSGAARRLAGGDVKAWFDTQFGNGWGDVLVMGVMLGLVLLLARFLYRRQIFLRV
jgi:predicted acyltransferase